MPMLYLVATPIGNMDDISVRALDTLRQVDIIASEDTRKTGMLLKRFGIQKPQMPFHEHNEERAGGQIIRQLEQGKSVALVTNAGTPGISDPGYTLVRKAIDEGIELTLIPGPAAFVMALVLSGLPVHSFTFRGFAPRKPGPRRKFLEIDRDSPHTLIFYESLYRLGAFLEDALTVYGDRDAALAHELTKLHESVERGTISHLTKFVEGEKPRGEYVIAIAGVGRISAISSVDDASEDEGDHE
ncbi:MAG TPA: 16S rRNA (cytidine(1402)-2'-O)-methyltransferase [Chloroflexia bacterium]|nr:16S rRNA (cytidine(1402)-2'-O)-methyltransferase [Chloroflexia bacterium]